MAAPICVKSRPDMAPTITCAAPGTCKNGRLSGRKSGGLDAEPRHWREIRRSVLVHETHNAVASRAELQSEGLAGAKREIERAPRRRH